jgi:Uma2 family endonuclease
MGPGHAAQRRYTIEDFVRLEEYANVRHEFCDGQIFAMAGGTPEHGTWTANIIGLLTAQLRGKPCRVQTSDVRIRVSASGLDTYPDVSVVCGHAERDVQDPNAIANPVVLVEVLSASTELYDRGEKLDHYKKIPSLREVVFVSHDQRRVEVVRRSAEGWGSLVATGLETIRLESVGAELPVEEVYRDPLAG